MDPHPHIEASWRALEQTEDGLVERALRELSPRQGDAERFQFDLVSSTIERPKYDERACVRRGMTLAAPQKITIRLIVWDTSSDLRTVEDIKEQELYNGEVPIRTELGTVVHDGAHRAIRSELAPPHGLFPFERGWRVGYENGDHLELAYGTDGIEVTARTAEDGVPSLLSRQPAAVEAPPRKKVSIVEPKLPTRVSLRNERDAISFFESTFMPDSVIAHESVPRSLFDDDDASFGWRFETLQRVLAWLETDEARRLSRETPPPVRVLGPGHVLARWIRRGLFLSGHHALARAKVITFGPREKPRKTADFTWLPHDTWNVASAMTLLRARLSSEAHAPPVRLAFALEAADVLRSVRIPAYMTAPKGWTRVAVGKSAVADLPVVAIDERGFVARPDVFVAATLSNAVALGAPVVSREPLALEAPEPPPIESTFAAAAARLGGAVRLASSDVSGGTVVAVDERDGAYALEDSRGLISWVEAPALVVDEDTVREESPTVTAGPIAPRSAVATTRHFRDETLALGRLVRIGFDLRVPPGALWLSAATLGDRAFSAERARVVESVLRDTRWGAQAWEGANESDTLASVGQRVSNGQALATVSAPAPLEDDRRSPEQKLLDAIEGRPASLVREPVLWAGPDAVVSDRRVFSRRGRDEIAPQTAERARAAAVIARRRALVERLDEPTRSNALDALRELEWRLERGDDLPPGVISIAWWTLRWTEPVARGSVLATLSGHPFSIDQVTNERFFEGASAVDAVINPASRDAVRVEALAFAAVAASGQRALVAPGTTFESILRDRGIDPSSDGPLALYFVRTR
ncbi:MAG: hypothetical protein JNK05_17340 [Myxococcales bacterium]|nr:hypothetical protein [Myxococcales bacterium]